MSVFRTVEHTSDICIIGAGMAGICAAIAAARNGATVTLINDRAVLGGNASEEIRMWICGAFGANMRETGIIEEIELENIYRNPQKNYSQWSALLFDFVTREANIELVLNASVLDADVAETGGVGATERGSGARGEPDVATPDAPGTTIRSVTAWQTTTQRYHTIAAMLFIDCSGDSILAPLTGAEHRWGREEKTEFGESHAVDTADAKTMGMSCLIQVRETEKPQRFIPPEFAHRYEREHIGPGRSLDLRKTNFWWLESGGEGDTIHDTETVRDDLLAVATGVWDLIKRYEDDYDARNWTLDWLGFLPGKRESRRYVGDHIISQGDVEAGGPFEDVIAYAGWSMDNHAPAGFYDPGEPTVFHPAPSPWAIPYRALYSKNVTNLMCAGRNISASHIA
ncbi:MAG: FAD-dependent oxidoreductase, partial [Spirochaetaceae bacterium]